jgi:hypothetical protein
MGGGFRDGAGQRKTGTGKVSNRSLDDSATAFTTQFFIIAELATELATSLSAERPIGASRTGKERPGRLLWSIFSQVKQVKGVAIA